MEEFRLLEPVIEYSEREAEWQLLFTNITVGNNHTEELNSSSCCESGPKLYIVPIVFALIVVLGCVGNALVIIVVIKNKDHVRNTTNLFILNLAIADTLFLVFCVPFHAIIYSTGVWPLGEIMCKFVHLLQCTSMVASVFTLVAMAGDRYLAVGHPLGTKHLRTPSMALGVSLTIWVLAIALAVPWPIYFTVLEYPGIGAVCSDMWDNGKSTYFLLLFVLSYLIPLITIFILSVLMIRKLWSVQSTDGPARESSLKAKRKVTKLIIVVVVVFCICWMPTHVLWLWINFFPDTVPRTYTFFYSKVFSHALAYANSGMNPVIYAFLSTQFRKGFNRALHMQCSEVGACHHPPPHSSVRFTTSRQSYSLTASNGQRSSTSVGDTML